MAICQKTIEYAFDSRTTSLASNTRHDFSSRTLTIEETTNRVFKSVILEVTIRDNQTTAGSFSSWTLGIKLGAAAFSDTVVTTSIPSTSEHQVMKFVSGNLASYFNTNFGAGTTQTCQAGIIFNGTPTINHTAKLIITYEFDDSGQTLRTKTVRIPLESSLTALTNTLTEIGTNQVPTLSGGASPFLPENSIAVKDLWFEFEANESANATTDFSLALSLDAEGEVQDGLHEQQLNSSPWYKYIWRRTDMNITTTHAFKARSTVTTRMSLPTVTLYVTYTYNHTNSTRVLNSIIVPFHIKTPPHITALYHTFAERFSICEPGPIELKQSGVRFNIDSGTPGTIDFKFGEQTTASGYVFTTGSVLAGQFTTQSRLDSGSRHGVGITLSAGHDNYIKGRVNVSTSDLTFYIGGYGIINYHSDIFSLGADRHNHTTYWLDAATGLAASTPLGPQAPVVNPTISGANYWISAIGHQCGSNGTPNTGSIYSNPTYLEIGRNVAVSGSHITAFHGWTYPSASANRYLETWSNTTDFWDRRPDYPLPSITTSGFFDPANYRYFYVNYNSIKHMQSTVTYHTMTYVVSGTISGYTGDGSGISVHVRDPNDYIVASGISTAGGYYTTYVYDNRPGYVADARQDGTHIGRSDNITPSQP